jgi:hypothetical protein
MTLPALLLFVVVAAPPQEAAPTPAPEEPAAAEPAAVEQTAPAAPAPAAPAPAAATGSSASSLIEEGLAAFRKRRFREAETLFRQATEADPSSAAAAFYLGYTTYKIAEPKRPFHPEKQKAAELFARAYELDPGFKPVWGPRR